MFGPSFGALGVSLIFARHRLYLSVTVFNQLLLAKLEFSIVLSGAERGSLGILNLI